MLLVLAGFLAHAGYKLVGGASEIRPLRSVEEGLLGRLPASVGGVKDPSAVRGASLSISHELNCSASETVEIGASRMRLAGALCGSHGTMDPPVKPVVRNTANESKGSVFVDLTAGRFLTDYLVLAPGENKIEIEFPYSGGRTFKKKLTVTYEAAFDSVRKSAEN